MSRDICKRLSNLMLISAFISTLFYSASYPYIYAELMKVVPTFYISLEQLLACVGTLLICSMWNKYSDRLFKHYAKMLVVEIIADVYLFADVLIRNDLKFYFLLNILIYSIITKHIACGGTKMRARVNPTEKTREKYDNNLSIVCSVATLLGIGLETILSPKLTTLFILALIGNTIDNFFYLYIYRQIIKNNLKSEDDENE